MIRRVLWSGVAVALLCAGVHAANDSLETVEVTASREKMRREISTFVHQVTRLEGEFVGRWRGLVCPMAVGVSDTQAYFIESRLVEVQNQVRKRKEKVDPKCAPNTFIIISDRSRPGARGLEGTRSRHVSMENPRRRVAFGWHGPRADLAQRHPDGVRWQGRQ